MMTMGMVLLLLFVGFIAGFAIGNIDACDRGGCIVHGNRREEER